MTALGRLSEHSRRPILRVALTLLACAMARLALAESLWPAQGDSLYKDKKAFKIGDVLTVNVMESASARHQINTNAKKSSSNSISWGSQHSKGVPFSDFGIGGSENFTGGGRSARSGDLTGKITVRVTDVLPNGNLVINGNRVITVNDERQVMEITGIVRPEDVTAENAVLSQLIADAQIKYTGKGAVAEKARLGIISRFLSMLFAI